MTEDDDLEAPGSDEAEADIAIGALAAARQMTSTTNTFRPRRTVRRRRAGGVSYSGARADSRDPTSIQAVVQQTADRLGWTEPLARARVLGCWPELVGADIAARCTPTSLTESVLRVSAETTSWAMQLQLMSAQIVAKVSVGLPAGTVTKIVFTGPSGPPRVPGRLRMYRGRGDRDTYG